MINEILDRKKRIVVGKPAKPGSSGDPFKGWSTLQGPPPHMRQPKRRGPPSFVFGLVAQPIECVYNVNWSTGLGSCVWSKREKLIWR